LKLDDVYDGMAHTMKKGFGTGRVFGEPIKVNEHVTIIPVARVNLGGGGGGGEEKKDSPGTGKKSGGQGFGFGGAVKPMGYIKIKGSCVKFKRICDWEQVMKMMMPPVCLCLLIVKHKMKMMHGHPHHMGPCDKKMMMHGMPGHHMGHGPMHECHGHGHPHMHHHPQWHKEMMKKA